MRGVGHLSPGGLALTLAGPSAVVAAIVVTNLPALLGIVHPNPLATVGVAANHVASGYLPGQWYTDPNIGWTAQALGHRAALDWLHLRVPWWNPFEGVGSPLAAEMQSAAFFPPVLLFALSNGSLLFHLSLEVAGGLAMYFLVRELGLSRIAATAGGLLFGVNGTFSWLPHAPMNPVALLPLLLLGIERCYRRPGRSSGFVLVAVAFALSVYAGFPETAYIDTIFGALWAAVRIGGTPRGQRLRTSGLLALGGVAGLLCSLPLALPFAEYLRHAAIGNHASAIGLHHLHPVSLAMLGLPYLYGPLAAYLKQDPGLSAFVAPIGGYLSATTLVLAIAGLLGARRDRAVRVMLGAVAVVVLLWTFGVGPFASVSRLFPYMVHVEITRYDAPVLECALILLACFGLDALGSDKRARLGFLVGGVGTLAIGSLILLGPAGKAASHLANLVPSAHGYAVAMTLWSGVMVVLVATVGVLGRRRWAAAVACALAMLDAAVLGGVPQLSAPRAYAADTAPVSYLSSHLGYGRYFSFFSYHSDYGSYFGLSQLNETDLPVPSAFATEITHSLGRNNSPVRFDGKQVASPNRATPVEMVLAHFDAYESLGTRYFLVPDASPVFGHGPRYPAELRLVFHDSFVEIFATPHPAPYFATSGARCLLTPASRDLLTATCPSPALLLRSELDLPGWAATVNGRPVPVLARQGLLSAIRLPAGRSTVEFSYAPPHIDLALGGFAAGLALIVIVPIWRRRRARSTDSTEHAVRS